MTLVKREGDCVSMTSKKGSGNIVIPSENGPKAETGDEMELFDPLVGDPYIPNDILKTSFRLTVLRRVTMGPLCSSPFQTLRHDIDRVRFVLSGDAELRGGILSDYS